MAVDDLGAEKELFVDYLNKKRKPFATHKLNEVIAVTDRVAVFRDGKVIAEKLTSQTTAQELANLMVGRKVSLSVTVPAMLAPEKSPPA